MRRLLALPDTCALAAAVPLGRPTRAVTHLRRNPGESFARRARRDGEPFRG